MFSLTFLLYHILFLSNLQGRGRLRAPWRRRRQGGHVAAQGWGIGKSRKFV